MLKTWKKAVSLVLVFAMSMMVCVPAFAAEQNTKEKFKDSGNSSIMIENGVSYDLSNLRDAAAYFQKHPELVTFNDAVINRSIENLRKYKDTLSNVRDRQKVNDIISTLRGENTETNRTKNYILSTTYYDLQTKLYNNTQTMYAEYTVEYYAAGADPLKAAAIAYAATGVFFASKVRSGGDWDYKQDFDRYDSPVEAYVDSRYVAMQAQDVGNIHYGYVGSTYFAPTVLKSAAGLAQIAGGHPYWDFSSYFDDPRDQQQIQRGIDYFNSGNFK